MMRSTSSGIQGAVIIGLAVGFALVVLSLAKLASMLGLPFMDVLENARVLLLAPVMFLAVLAIDKLRVPLPFRLENSWPAIAAALWLGIHRLIVMKVEQAGLLDDIGYEYGLPPSAFDFPWYAQSWFMWTVFAAIFVLCSLLNKYLNDN